MYYFSTFPSLKGRSLNPMMSTFVIRVDTSTEPSETDQISRRGKGGLAPLSLEYDVQSFLLQKTSEKQVHLAAQGAAEHPIPESPCQEFGPLPVSPLIMFPDSNFPVNVVQEYTRYRSTLAELKEFERLPYVSSVLPDRREGAIVHCRGREWTMANAIKLGVNLYQMCAAMEDATHRLCRHQRFTRGLAFRCECPLDSCAAHYTPIHDDG
jgi:methionyl aminopeptidase